MRGAALALISVAMVDLREIYQSAVDAHRQGDLPTALSRYRDVIRLNPGIAAVHNNVAAICLSQGEVAEAEASWRTAVGLQSNYPEAHFNLAVLLSERAASDARRLETLADAARHCAAALEHRPSYVAAHHLMGNILVSQDRPDAAKLHYQLASSLADVAEGPPAPLPARWDGVRVGHTREMTINDGDGPSARTMRTLSLVPLILEIPAFLAPAECDAIVDLASPRLQASPKPTTTTTATTTTGATPATTTTGLSRYGRRKRSRAQLTKRLAARGRVEPNHKATEPPCIRAKDSARDYRKFRGLTGNLHNLQVVLERQHAYAAFTCASLLLSNLYDLHCTT